MAGRRALRFHPAEVSDAFRIEKRAAAMEISLAELQELVSVEGQLADAFAAHGGSGFAPGTEAPTDSSSHGNRDPKGTIGDHPAEAWCQSHRAYRPGDADTRHRDQENADHIKGGRPSRCRPYCVRPEARAYEIAAYGTAAAFAGQLDLRDEQKMLYLSLEEERRADAMLTQLAKREVNPDAWAA
jgi:hypothetical protein